MTHEQLISWAEKELETEKVTQLLHMLKAAGYKEVWLGACVNPGLCHRRTEGGKRWLASPGRSAANGTQVAAAATVSKRLTNRRLVSTSNTSLATMI